ncbi:bifunctional Uracil-DNA glycosylase-like domain superfamily/Uracil-DNA glycosylase family 1/Uracil-DNA glycosylase-like/Uracil-DNA glycosylase [Babesia duncani]|uniref:Uracil-DNA glycosylase n=1 Tax=Babesia duncani TaxID=323732 RepID=A0AAD9UP87_9APIC|nr:bifunctional Uracil-DNA glycosylase-like domain superfamily/Uracil-DNA glycosylase family 1/Uracil-DNA glycosylase-like/Uracil-DNA glycosylase [Babesia duncani]
MAKRLITEFFGPTKQPNAKRIQKETIKTSFESISHSDHTNYIDSIKEMLGEEWAQHLDSEIRKPYFAELWMNVTNERKSKKVYPPEHLVFNVFKLVPLSNIKVVIVGQDPYHQPKQAMGLSFSVPRGVPLPPSLRNIFNEIGIQSSHGDLTNWAKQGVFLLNCILTVVDSHPFAHKDYGWSIFTDKVIEIINKNKSNTVFLLWGNPAKQKCANISKTKHCILTCGHPSPLSIKYFKGCDHFNKCNDYLKSTNQKPIDWQLLS